MPLMTSLYTGVSGLRSSQNALNITSHNLSNVNTEGYVRQQATFADLRYTKVGNGAVNTWQIGIGVESDHTRHIRDIFLDRSYRLESGKAGFYSSLYGSIEEIETVFGELEDEEFQNTITKFKEAINELAKKPENLPARAGLVMYAEEFLNRSDAAYKQLLYYQQDLDVKIKNTVDRINELGDIINNLNEQIRGFEAAKVESANDLRDERDRALDELAGLVKIDYEEEITHSVSVKIEGTDFVTDTTVFHLATAELDGDNNSMYSSVIWPYLNGKELYYFQQDISPARNQDVGSLKGLLMSRGDFVAKYTDLPVEGSPDYADRLQYYHDNIEYSTIMKTQAMFDKLVNGVVTAINSVLCPEKEINIAADTTFTLGDGSTVTYAAGTTLKVLDTDRTSHGNDRDKTVGTELFARKDADRYTKATDASGKVYYIYNDLNEFGTESLYTLGNIEINKKILDDYSYLPLTTKQGEADYKKAEELSTIWNRTFSNLNPDNLTPKTFEEYYTSFTGYIADQGKLFSDVSANQQMAADNVNNSRLSFYNVSSEEELTNMIRYQNAYNANSRYVTTVSQMLEHIINALGT